MVFGLKLHKTLCGKHQAQFSTNDVAVILLFILFFLILFIYLFLAALGLHCWARAFSSCGERGLLFLAARRLLTAVASLVAEHRL